jgi:Fe-S-cluster containining protein
MKKVLFPLFERYEKVIEQVDQAFEKISVSHPDEVRCKEGCSDCCHALFDLTLIEALYINHHFHRHLPKDQQEAILELANTADRAVYKLKRQAYQDLKKGVAEEELLQRLAEERVRCPLLDEKDRCLLYAWRPVTCRLYGVPTAIGGRAHTCGISGFDQGKSYPTANLDPIQKALYTLSEDTVSAIRSRYSRLAELLVPLSMALLTTYDDDYLGVGDCKSGPGPESLDIGPKPGHKKKKGHSNG